MWYPNTRALSADRPVYAIDTPGDPGRSVQREPIHQPERAAQWLDETLAGLGLDRVHLVGSSYGGWLALNQAHRRPDRLASVTLLDPGGLEKVGLRFFVWIFASLFATFAPKALRPRLAAWLEQPVLVVPELRTMIRTAVRAYRIRRPAPLPPDRRRVVHHPYPAPPRARQAQPARAPRAANGARAPPDTGNPGRDHLQHRSRTTDRPRGRGQPPNAGFHGLRRLTIAADEPGSRPRPQFKPTPPTCRQPTRDPEVHADSQPWAWLLRTRLT
ncbi:alpha/beta fold hydrolase [Streptomyces sp. RLB1-33]